MGIIIVKPKPYKLLDKVSGASMAFSLRRLSMNYTGPAIRVRRSSDNAELDIGFVGEQLDVDALLSFVGSGSAFITIWYDQSGLGLNAIQTNAIQQPRIVNNGVLDTRNNLPALRFLDANSHRLLTTGGASWGRTFYFSAVVHYDLSTTNVNARFLCLPGTESYFFSPVGDLSYRNNGTNVITSLNMERRLSVVGISSNTTSHLSRQNLMLETVGAALNADFGVLNTIGGDSAVRDSSMWLQELVVYIGTDCLSVRNVIEHNQFNYYDIIP